MIMIPNSTLLTFAKSSLSRTSPTVFLLVGTGFLLYRILIFSAATTVDPPSSLCTDSLSCAIVVVEGLMSGKARVKVGFREDFKVRETVGSVGVAPGAGGAVGVDFG